MPHNFRNRNCRTNTISATRFRRAMPLQASTLTSHFSTVICSEHSTLKQTKGRKLRMNTFAICRIASSVTFELRG